MSMFISSPSFVLSLAIWNFVGGSDDAMTACTILVFYLQCFFNHYIQAVLLSPLNI